MRLLPAYLTALRSGQYKQNTGCLRFEDTFCALGVALDIYDPTGWREPDDETQNPWHIGEELMVLREDFGLSDDLTGRIITLNDEKYLTFPEIADFIEGALECES